MGLLDRISKWREGGSEAREKRRERRRRHAREAAAAAEQKARTSASATTSVGAAADKGRRPTARRRTAAGDPRRLGSGVGSAGIEVAKLAREMLVIPLQLWLAGAEIAGKGVLWLWLRVALPALRALRGISIRCLHLAERHVTPAGAVAAIGVVAIGALAASQWLDYRSVSVGSDAYSGTVGIVAPAPEVDTEIAGDAHAWAMLPLAVVALVALALALGGRRRAALALVPVGIVVIAISLAVDAPKGLDEGETAIAYEGARASLLEGFWMQIATGTVLIVSGLLLPYYLRPAPAGAAGRQTTGPTPAAVIASRAKDAFGRVRVPRPKLGRRAGARRRERKEPAKGEVQGAGT